MTVSCDLVNYKKMVAVQMKTHAKNGKSMMRPLTSKCVIWFETLKNVKEMSAGGKVCPSCFPYKSHLSLSF